MASAEFLEEALNTNVDESAVSAIVGSLETLVTTASGPSGQHKVLNGSLQLSHTMGQEPNKVVTSNFNPNSQINITSNVSLNQLQGRVQGFMPNVSQGNLTLIQGKNYQQAVSTAQGNITNLNNRVIYPAQSLPNRTIALAPFSQSHVLQAGAGGSIQTMGKPVQIQSPLIIKQGTNMNQVGIRPNMVTVPMSNATMGGSIPVEIVNKNMGQNIVTTQTLVQGAHGTLPANVQIVNMRPGTPVGVQKNVAAVSPRVVIGSQQVIGGGSRPAGQGITLQTIQGFQPGQQGHLLLKTENGQFQLLRVGPPAPGTPAGQAIRLTMPGNQTSSSPITVVSSSLANSQPPLQQAPVNTQQQQQHQMQTALVATNATQQQVRPANQVIQGTVANQRTPVDNLKEKCRKFLSNLLDLSSKEPKTVERNVRILIQELIDMKVEPEAFCQRLEKLLDASPQPCLIGFLKKTLPILRLSLVNKELVIEGIHPPPLSVVFPNATTNSPAIQNVQTVTQQSMATGHIQIQGQNRAITQHQVNQSMPAPAPVAANKPTPLRHVTKPQQHSLKTFVKVASNIPPSPGPMGISKQLSKEKEKKSVTQFAQSSFSDIDKMAADDDINDVAAMGGVNLAEESQKILRSTEMIGTQIRSCKDEYLASMGPLQTRLKQIAAKHGLDEPSFDVAALISHALQERLKNLVEKLACIAEHRLDIIKLLPTYEVTQDVKGQLKFLEDLDRVERKRREEYEREILLRAAKSRSKTEDPEQVKLKEKAKEMQRAEMEEMRQREANLTALQAIGQRKKPRIGPSQSESVMSSESSMMDVAMGSKMGASRSAAPLRARMKRVNYRDLLFLLEQEKDTVRSHFLYKCYLK